MDSNIPYLTLFNRRFQCNACTAERRGTIRICTATIPASADMTWCARYAQPTARDIKNALLSANTRKGYHYDWAAVRALVCRDAPAELPASPETVSLFVAAELLRSQKISTITRRVAVIAHAHKAAGLESRSLTASTSCCAAPAGCGASSRTRSDRWLSTSCARPPGCWPATGRHRSARSQHPCDWLCLRAPQRQPGGAQPGRRGVYLARASSCRSGARSKTRRDTAG